MTDEQFPLADAVLGYAETVAPSGIDNGPTFALGALTAWLESEAPEVAERARVWFTQPRVRSV